MTSVRLIELNGRVLIEARTLRFAELLRDQRMKRAQVHSPFIQRRLYDNTESERRCIEHEAWRLVEQHRARAQAAAAEYAHSCLQSRVVYQNEPIVAPGRLEC